MSDQARQALLDLALKGFLPLLMVAAVLYGAYKLLYSSHDLQERTLEFIFKEVVEEQKRTNDNQEKIMKILQRIEQRQDNLVPLIKQMVNAILPKPVPPNRDKQARP